MAHKVYLIWPQLPSNCISHSALVPSTPAPPTCVLSLNTPNLFLPQGLCVCPSCLLGCAFSGTPDCFLAALSSLLKLHILRETFLGNQFLISLQYLPLVFYPALSYHIFLCLLAVILRVTM